MGGKAAAWRDPSVWHWHIQGQVSFLRCNILGAWPHGFGGSQSYPWLPDRLAQQWWNADSPLATAHWVKQVHGNRVYAVSADEPEPAADAVLTATPGTSAWVSSADCVPILMATEQTVVAIHAGWRGTAAGITAKAAAQLLESSHQNPSALRVAIGPCISGRNYQVSQAVANQVLETIPVAAQEDVLAEDPLPDKARLDLALVNAWQVLELGIPIDQIAISPFCTYENASDFFSYRRLGTLRVGTDLPRVQWSGIGLPLL